MTPKDLEVFLGKWKKAGRAHESPFGPAATVTAVETFDWLECRPLLLQRRRHERVAGESPRRSVAIQRKLEPRGPGAEGSVPALVRRSQHHGGPVGVLGRWEPLAGLLGHDADASVGDRTRG